MMSKKDHQLQSLLLTVTLTVTLITSTQLSGCIGAINFRDHPATATVLLNFRTSLSCTANLPYPSSIMWQFNGGVIVPDGVCIIASYDPVTSGRSELIITGVAYKNAGNYTCLALDSSNTVIISSQSAEITVLGPPTFESSLAAIVIQHGDTANFQCVVVSNPPSTVSWYYELGNYRRPLNSSGRVTISPANVLTITDVQERDVGYYVCSAENNFGLNTTSGRLILQTAVQPVEVRVTPTEPDPLEVLEGEGFTLYCTVTNASISSILWTTQSGQDVTGVSQTSNFHLLSIFPATLMDTDLYTCTATDSSGRTSSQSIEVVVTRPPVFLREPDDVTGTINMPLKAELVCTASGHPPPVISWLDHNLFPIVIDQVTQSPLITAGGTLMRIHTGVYTCLATNSAGEIRSQFTITVEAPPLFVTSPADVTSPPEHHVVFNCMADGVPPPTYMWTKVGGDLPPNALQSGALGQDLLLFDVTSVLSGAYQCTATNSLGSAKTSANLIVLERPHILTATSSPLITEVGCFFSLNCNSSGPPEMELNWYFNGTRLDPVSDKNLVVETNGTLSVSNAHIGYTGFYMCNVSTSFAFVTAEVHVIVGVQPLILVPPVDRDLIPGYGFVLDCVAIGIPNPHSSWFRTNFISGQREELGVVSSSYFQLSTGLQLVDVGRNESGLYECLVENALGNASETATVRVESSPVVRSIFPSIIVANDNVTLTCSTSYNYPPGSIRWSRGLNDDPLPTSRFSVDREGGLHISPVLVEDTGSITCSVTNQYGHDSLTSDIQVQYAPLVNITSGSTIEAILNNTFVLSCDVHGEPQPSTSWIFPDGSVGNKVGISQDAGALTVVGVDADDSGTYICRAINLHGCSSDTADVSVVGPAIPKLSVVPGTENKTGVQVQWDALDSVTQRLIDIYEVWTITHSRMLQEVISHDSLGFLARNAILSGLSAGTIYKVTIRGVFGGLLGLNSSILATTQEDRPSGPPLNFTVTSVGFGAILEWLPPAEDKRNGIILSYDVEYRLALEGEGGAFTQESYAPTKQTSYGKALVFNLSGLEQKGLYEVRLSARTSVGGGPATPTQTFVVPLQEFRPLEPGKALTVAVSAGAGSAGVVILVILVTLMSHCCYRRRTRKGKHKPRSLVGTMSASQNTSKKRKGIIGRVPDTTLQLDRAIHGKFTVQAKNRSPKVSTACDVATPITPWVGVKEVQSKNAVSASPIQYGRSGVYSEVIGLVKTQPTPRNDQGRVGRVSEVSDQLYEELNYDREVNAPQPSLGHVERSIEPNPGRDDSQPLYASISQAHVEKKRKKKMKELLVVEAKETKQWIKMQKKMERERLKMEEKELSRRLNEETKKNKIQETERKKRAKDERLRENMGLSNIASYQDIDFVKSGSRVQAQFIDAATAALF